MDSTLLFAAAAPLAYVGAFVFHLHRTRRTPRPAGRRRAALELAPPPRVAVVDAISPAIVDAARALQTLGMRKGEAQAQAQAAAASLSATATVGDILRVAFRRRSTPTTPAVQGV